MIEAPFRTQRCVIVLIRTVPSCDPDARVASSGPNITVVTLSLCSLNVAVSDPFSAFHSRTVLSDAADAMNLPRGRMRRS